MTNIFPVLHLETLRVHNSLFEKQETVLKRLIMQLATLSQILIVCCSSLKD